MKISTDKIYSGCFTFQKFVFPAIICGMFKLPILQFIATNVIVGFLFGTCLGVFMLTSATEIENKFDELVEDKQFKKSEFHTWVVVTLQHTMSGFYLPVNLVMFIILLYLAVIHLRSTAMLSLAMMVCPKSEFVLFDTRTIVTATRSNFSIKSIYIAGIIEMAIFVIVSINWIFPNVFSFTTYVF